MTLARDETFGPVVSIYRVATATRRSRAPTTRRTASTRASGVRPGGPPAGARLHVGTVNVNEGYAAAWASHAAPMGGMRDSGMGRRHGREGLLTWTEPQTVAVQRLLPVTYLPGVAPERYARVMTAAIRVLRPGSRPDERSGARARRRHRRRQRLRRVGRGAAAGREGLPRDRARGRAPVRRRRAAHARAGMCGSSCGRRGWGALGIQRVHALPHVVVLAGAGVGGGSLVYANTLYRAARRVLRRPAVGAPGRLAGRARPALRHRRAHARRGAPTRP